VGRRAFLTGLGAAILAAPLSARAQLPGKVYRIGILFEGTPIAEMVGREPRSALLREFLRGLRELGYVEGQNAVIERHSAEGKPERLRALATALVRLGPDVILASGERTTPALLATTSAVPIVQPTLTDPVERGYAKSLARPGDNITGLSLHVDQAIYGKLIEILKEAAPRITSVAVLHRVSRPAGATSPLLETITPAAERLRIRLVSAVVEREDQFVEAVTTMERERADALIAELNGINAGLRMRIIQFAMKSRIPTAFGTRSFAEAGALLSYGANVPEQFRRAAAYVDRILKGARPGDLPIEQPTKFEFIINLKTAKALGLTIPQSVLARADEVIE
jgi:ABC-type uncharacterized transport system substrate-binding protein